MHKHDEVIQEWAKDTSKILQYEECIAGIWKWTDYVYDNSDDLLQPDLFCIFRKWRIKPRKFEVGAYYPAISRKGKKAVVMCVELKSGIFFEGNFKDGCGYTHSLEYFKTIGEKLEIEWPT